MATFTSSGRQDLAVANKGGNNVSVFLGNGDGTFTTGSVVTVGSAPAGLAAGNFNGDNYQDLAVANSGSANVSILLSNGNGTFATAVNYGVGSSPMGIVAADFNADTFSDLAVANSGSDSVSVLLGAGTGTFPTKIDYAVVNQPGALAVGNFGLDAGGEGDSYPDLVVANQATATVSLLLNPGTEFFGGPAEVSGVANPNGVALGDFNKDGQPDAVVTGNPPGGGRTFFVNAFAPAPMTSVTVPKITGPVLGVAVAAQAPAAAWANAKGQVVFYRYRGASAAAFKLPPQKTAIDAIALSPDGRFLATVGRKDRQVKVWNVSGMDGASLVYTTVAGPSQVRAVAFSPDGKFLVVGGGAPDKEQYWLKLFAVAAGVNPWRSLDTFTGKNEASLTALAFRDRKTLATGTEYGRVIQFDVSSGKLKWRDPVLTGLVGSITSLAYSRTGRYQAIAGTSGEVKVWDSTNMKWLTFDVKEPKPGGKEFVAVTFDATGKKLITGDSAGTVQVWDVATEKREKSLQVTKGKQITVVAISKDNKSYLVGGQQGTAGPQPATRLALPRAPK